MNLLRTRKLELDTFEESYRLTIYTPHIANRVNRLLGGYYDCVIQKGDEPVFTVSEQELRFIWDDLGLSIPFNDCVQNRAKKASQLKSIEVWESK